MQGAAKNKLEHMLCPVTCYKLLAKNLQVHRF